jgi:hypothetical protein
MLASSQLHPQPIQTINGKLIVAAPKESDCINIHMEDFAQKLEQIQFEVVVAQQQDRREYINQLKILKALVRNLERSYNHLLYTTIAAGVVLAALLIWMGLTGQPSSNKSQTATTVVALNNWLSILSH